MLVNDPSFHEIVVMFEDGRRPTSASELQNPGSGSYY